MALRIVETSDPAETESLGAELVPGLRDGDVVLVRGELGSGKTTLVRGAARALGVSDPVTSPTFSIGHRYRATNVTVSHLDLYRLQGLEHEDPALLADYLGPGRIAFVEWPPEADGELSSARLLVTLSHRGGDRRLIEVGSGPAGLADGPAAVADGQAGVVGGPAKVAGGPAEVAGGPAEVAGGPAEVAGGPAGAERGTRG